MPLVIPASSSTFGDSTFTQGDPLSRKYVLAQFRSGANFEWVREARARLVRDELKYAGLKELEHRLRQDRVLWSRIENGVGQASIIVIDPERVSAGITMQALHDGADLVELENDIGGLVDECATAIVGGTPIAYLPYNLMRAIPWRGLELVSGLDRFTPEHIRVEIGGGLKQAQIFAARAHAVFDLLTEDSSAVRTDDVFHSPAARVLLAELLATPRAFDIEAPSTLPILNDAAREIEKAITRTGASPDTPSLVTELDSRSRDELQAADVAAGWARELLDRGGTPALAVAFERVWVNGRRVR